MDSKFELQLLALLLKHENFINYSSTIESGMFSDKADDIYDCITELHQKYGEDISLPVLRQYALDTIVTAHKDIYIDLISSLEGYKDAISEKAIPDIISTIRDRYVAARVADAAISIVNGSSGSLSDISAMLSLAAGGKEVKGEIFTGEIDDLLKELDPNSEAAIKIDVGGTLKDIVPSIFKGMLGIIVASVNMGKSSFCANLNKGFLNQGKKVLYFANEEIPQKVLLNHVRAMCDCTEQGLRSNTVNRQPWIEVKNNFFLVPAHGFNMAKIESIVAKIKPDVVFIDQLDNVAVSGDDRRDIQLDRLYQRARLLASQYNCVMWAVSQASDDASDRAVVKMNMIANSKVGKAGAADLIIGIGKSASTNVEEDNLRCLTVSKNKITGVEKSVYVQFFPDRCQYAA